MAQTALVEPPGSPASLSEGESLSKPAFQLTTQQQEPTAPSPPASAEPKVTLPRASFPLVGTWEFVSAKTADGKENQAYLKAFKDKRYIKIITPTHFICVTIDPTTGKITGAHGGPCLLGNEQLTDWPQYATTPSWVQNAKGNHFKMRFDGDKFVQSFENGNEETWRRAKTVDVPATATRPGTEKAITLPLVGTWEFVSAKTADGKENQAYDKAFKDKRAIKMITPTHYICVYIDLTTRKITSAHGGPCLLGNGEITTWPQYGTDPWWVQGAKAIHFKVRFEGDKHFLSHENGKVETWCRAKAADVTAAAPRLGTEKAITLTGEAFCAKCALKQAQTCQLALQVEDGGARIVYFLQPEEVRKRLESQLEKQGINWCATPTKVVATGIDRQIDGRPVVVASRLEPARSQ